MSKAGTFSPVSRLRKKKSFDDQGLDISETVAIPGLVSVALGIPAFGSAAGVGISICGVGCAVGGSARLARITSLVPSTRTSSTATSPPTRRKAMAPPGERRDDPDTPGIAGISGLKRLGEGWSGIPSLKRQWFRLHCTKRD